MWPNRKARVRRGPAPPGDLASYCAWGASSSTRARAPGGVALLPAHRALARRVLLQGEAAGILGHALHQRGLPAQQHRAAAPGSAAPAAAHAAGRRPNGHARRWRLRAAPGPQVVRPPPPRHAAQRRRPGSALRPAAGHRSVRRARGRRRGGCDATQFRRLVQQHRCQCGGGLAAGRDGLELLRMRPAEASVRRQVGARVRAAVQLRPGCGQKTGTPPRPRRRRFRSRAAAPAAEVPAAAPPKRLLPSPR